MRLKRFWLKFNLTIVDSAPPGILQGIGVTAYNYEDAIELIKVLVFNSKKLPKITKCVENIDVNDLDHDHVLPNMGDVTERGIWFPLGYQSSV